MNSYLNDFTFVKLSTNIQGDKVLVCERNKHGHNVVKQNGKRQQTGRIKHTFELTKERLINRIAMCKFEGLNTKELKILLKRYF